MEKSQKKLDEAETPFPWGPTTRAIASIAIAFHVFCVVLPPFDFASAFGPGRRSPVTSGLRRAFASYIGVMNLDHGYFFFAPDPGPSHILEYQLLDREGNQVGEGRLPDRSSHWPRLLYHRHFMLAEQYNDFATPDSPPPKPEEPKTDNSAERRAYLDAIEQWRLEEREWREAHNRFVAIGDSFKKHLKDRFHCETVVLKRVEHQLFEPEAYARAKRPLTSPETYVNLDEPSTAEEVPWKRKSK